jgi:hypothetical protein
LDGENKEKLMAVAGMFNEMHGVLSRVLPYDKVNSLAIQPPLSPEQRKELAEALQKMAALEKQARAVVADILDNWEDAKPLLIPASAEDE